MRGRDTSAVGHQPSNTRGRFGRRGSMIPHHEHLRQPPGSRAQCANRNGATCGERGLRVAKRVQNWAPSGGAMDANMVWRECVFLPFCDVNTCGNCESPYPFPCSWSARSREGVLRAAPEGRAMRGLVAVHMPGGKTTTFGGGGEGTRSRSTSRSRPGNVGVSGRLPAV